MIGCFSVILPISSTTGTFVYLKFWILHVDHFLLPPATPVILKPTCHCLPGAPLHQQPVAAERCQAYHQGQVGACAAHCDDDSLHHAHASNAPTR